MTGKLIIEEGFLDSILDDMYELRGQLRHDKDFIKVLDMRIHKVKVMLKNVKPYEIICGKCGLREGGNQPTPTF